MPKGSSPFTLYICEKGYRIGRGRDRRRFLNPLTGRSNMSYDLLPPDLDKYALWGRRRQVPVCGQVRRHVDLVQMGFLHRTSSLVYFIADSSGTSSYLWLRHSRDLSNSSPVTISCVQT